MPANAIHVRQREVLRYLQRVGRPVTFPEIQRYILEQSPAGDLNDGYSERTFQRDLPLIAETFGFTIKNTRNQGYYIAEQEPLLPDQQRLLEAVELHSFSGCRRHWDRSCKRSRADRWAWNTCAPCCGPPKPATSSSWITASTGTTTRNAAAWGRCCCASFGAAGTYWL